MIPTNCIGYSLKYGSMLTIKNSSGAPNHFEMIVSKTGYFEVE